VIGTGRVEATPVSAMDLLPTIAALAGAEAPKSVTLDGLDQSSFLRGGKGNTDRLTAHYFGVQLQAVRKGKWKLFVPIEAPPAVRVSSLWFEHQPGLFERQHRTWMRPTLYDLDADLGESKDVAAEHPEVVAELLKAAGELDQDHQSTRKPVQYLPGPTAPRPGQIRQASDDVSEWIELAR
jgi:arylsulfatase